MTNEELIEKAKSVAKYKEISEFFGVKTGEAGCALITDKNNIYLGVSIDACSGIGFCAEHSAIANMITNGEYRIKKIVAVTGDGLVIPPCGRCREFIYQINKDNLETDILVGKEKTVKLKDLLPDRWQERF